MHINLNELRPIYAKALAKYVFSTFFKIAANVYVSAIAMQAKGMILNAPILP